MGALSEEELVAFRTSQSAIREILGQLKMPTMQAVCRAPLPRSDGKRLRQVLRQFKRIFNVRCKARKAVLEKESTESIGTVAITAARENHSEDQD